MQATKLLSGSLLLSVAVGLSPVAFAQQGQPVAGYKLLTTINVPGGLAGFDISWVDSANARYYLADRGNATATPAIPPRVVVIDTLNDQYLTSISLPQAPNGVVAVPRAHELWVGLNDSTVAVISTDDNTVTHVIATGGKGLAVTPAARADELAYDPADRIILIANDRDTPPFVTFISEANHSVITSLMYDGNSAPQSTGGIEQPVWNGTAGKFYIAIPSTATNANGEIDEIDPHTYKVTRTFPTKCMGPAGLVLIPNQRLTTSCGDTIDIASGKVMSTAANAGGDEIWYNNGDSRVYFGGGTDRISVPVTDATINATTTLTSLVVGQIVASPGVSQTTHSVAADDVNNQVFVPVVGAGVQVWRNGASISATPNPIPVTGSDFHGVATISWNAPNAQTVEIHVGSPNGALFTQAGNRGSLTTPDWIADGMTFYLQDVTGGLPLTAANTLATVVVHLQKQ